jgi:hypothetical protein
MLTVYQGKINKNVLFLGSLHMNVNTANTEKKNPDTTAFYNSTKFGVNVLDQMVRQYPIISASRRCPVQVFFNILDTAATNAWILHKEVTGNKISRHNFILRLVDKLWQDYIMPKRSATVPDQGTPYQVPSVNSVKLLNVKKIKLKTLAFYAKKRSLLC